MSVRRTYNIRTPELAFEWDPEKEAANQLKHRVGFFEAVAVFVDPRGVLVSDPDHSHDEERFVLLGFGSSARILVVVHCYREKDAVVRIVSARPANRLERRLYSEGLSS